MHKTIIALIAASLLLISACDQNHATEDASAASLKADGQTENNSGASNYRGGFTRVQRVSDANMIIGLLERGYAHRAWKQEFLGISFEERSREFLNRVREEISDPEFYEATAKYLAGFHDSHISFNFPSTFRSVLPFEVDDIDGHIVVVGVDDSINSSGIRRGDELISIDGETAESVRERLKLFVGEGNIQTELAWATYYLTKRSQGTFPVVPTGKCRVQIRSHADNNIREFEFEWQTSGRPLAEMNDPGVDLESSYKAISSARDRKNFLEMVRNRISPHADSDLRFTYGSPNPFFDMDDTYVEHASVPFKSGVMPVGGRRIGFLRLHTFSNDMMSENDALAELEREIEYFENSTDALIIDETNNPGGDYCFMLKVASFFFSEPTIEIPDQWRANRENLVDLENLSMDSDATESDRAIAFTIVDGMRGAMQRGDLLTEPFPICNLNGRVEPYRTRDGRRILYTKPVLILANEFSVSCGDYFPAMMQDTGRAVIFGSTTSGGGGAVKGITQRIGYSEITMRYTITLGVRTRETELFDGISTPFIENVGVRPDVEFNITLDDFLNGYRAYKQAVELTVLNMIPR